MTFATPTHYEGSGGITWTDSVAHFWQVGDVTSGQDSTVLKFSALDGGGEGPDPLLLTVAFPGIFTDVGTGDPLPAYADFPGTEI